METEEGGGGRDPFQGHRGGEGVFPEKDVWPVLSVGYFELSQVTFRILTDLVMVPRLTISERKGSQSISLTGNHIDNRLEEYRGKNRLSVCELSMSFECNHILYVKVNVVAKSVPIIVKIHA